MTLTGTRVPGQRLPADRYQCLRCGRENQCHPGPKPTYCLACTYPADREAMFPDQPWAVDALCAQVDADAFFPTKGQTNKAAKAVCAHCPVTAECLAFALASGAEFGVWGGLSAHERRALVVVT